MCFLVFFLFPFYFSIFPLHSSFLLFIYHLIHFLFSFAPLLSSFSSLFFLFFLFLSLFQWLWPCRVLPKVGPKQGIHDGQSKWVVSTVCENSSSYSPLLAMVLERASITTQIRDEQLDCWVCQEKLGKVGLGELVAIIWHICFSQFKKKSIGLADLSHCNKISFKSRIRLIKCLLLFVVTAAFFLHFW